MFYSAVTGFAVISVLAAFTWQTPSWNQVAIGGIVGFFATLASLMQIFAYRNAPASLLAPFSYTQLVWAAALGYSRVRHHPGPVHAARRRDHRGERALHGVARGRAGARLTTRPDKPGCLSVRGTFARVPPVLHGGGRSSGRRAPGTMKKVYADAAAALAGQSQRTA